MGESLKQVIKGFFKDVRPNCCQFVLVATMVVFIGAIVSTCKITQALMTKEEKDDEGEFVVESKLQSTQFLVAFGISKAIANLVVGILGDILGRRVMMIVGWIFGIAVPVIVIVANSWNTVVISNIFLGIQQGLCWTLTIVYMIDYAGVKNRAFAIGINETIGYISVAVFNVIAAAMVDDDEQNYREDPYWMVLAFMILSLIISIFVLKDNKDQVNTEHKSIVVKSHIKKQQTQNDLVVKQTPGLQTEQEPIVVQDNSDKQFEGELSNKSPKQLVPAQPVQTSEVALVEKQQKPTSSIKLKSKELQTATITWPDNSQQKHSVFRLAFVQSSFLDTNLMCCNLVGLMINFLTAFAWGIFTKWMKTYGGDDWDKYSKEKTATVILIYSLPKGIFQFFFGFISDRVGRKKIVAIGLSICITALVFIAFVGEYGSDQDTVFALFSVGAFILGFGTSVMYSTALAASTENSLPITRASSLGTYRFWRDSGYWIGGLFLGAVADEVDIPVTIGITAIIVFIVILIWLTFYKDERRLYAPLEKQTSPNGTQADNQELQQVA